MPTLLGLRHSFSNNGRHWAVICYDEENSCVTDHREKVMVFSLDDESMSQPYIIKHGANGRLIWQVAFSGNVLLAASHNQISVSRRDEFGKKLGSGLSF
ncbi:hypothetical protein [Endozoicomonas sp.]|uniref:hypothetical protein n=1 Tax=Endozoicomonas sp. TaxID=1892382 RepID=UPI00288821A3|nr:hypothetical protein [Endozoicomonas sp.]